VKLIDLGSSCFNWKKGFSYVQSRYYRAPEIVMGLPYGPEVDMWSFGCIVFELATGRPIFPAIDENELVEMFQKIVGPLPKQMVNYGKKRRQFFSRNGHVIPSKKSRLASVPESDLSVRQSLFGETDGDFIDFIEVTNSF